MKRKQVPGWAAFLALALAVPATAQRNSGENTDVRGQARVEAVLEAWRAQNGSTWSMVFDHEIGRAQFIYGGRAEALFEPQTDEDFYGLAREALAATKELHGIDAETLIENRVVFLPLGNAGSNDKMTVQFLQQVNGVRVVDGTASVLFDMQGRLLTVDSTGLPGIKDLRTRPTYAAERAVLRATEAFQRDAGVAEHVHAPELVVLQHEVNGFREPRLAWRVDCQSHTGEAVGFEYYVDAHSGQVLERRASVHNFDVSGNVKSLLSPGTKPDIASNPPVAEDLQNLRVTSSQGSAVTDANGDFTIIGATAPVSATFAYVGPYHNVSNQAGANYSLNVNLTAATGNNVVMNTAPAQAVTAAANSMKWVNALREWTKAINPADTTVDFLVQSNVMVSGTCNAFFNGNSINFYPAGGSCPNTAYSTVVMHEEGHWLNVRYGSGNGSDGFGEGNADVFAMYRANNPVVGENFQGSGFVRSGLNTRQFCGDTNPGCYGGVHADGEVLMGALWKVRSRLQTTHGQASGGLIADTLFNAWMNAYNDGQIRTIIETHWLTLDDNDGNIFNGTPNFADIEGGFRQQGFPAIVLPAVIFSNVTQLGATTSTAGPYTVDADVVANLNPPLTGATLHYRLGSTGGFIQVPMTNIGGDTFTADIPGQPCPNIVQYYVSGSDSASMTSTFPIDAPTSALDFLVGVETVLFADNFETNTGWTTTIQGATSGQWERGVPVNDPGWQYDPLSDSDGSGQCFVTQNQVGNTDVDNGSVSLISPVLDLSGGANTIRYDYYLFLTSSTGVDRLLVEYNGNGGVGAWTTVVAHTMDGDVNWRTHEIKQSDLNALGVPLTANAVLRFTANDGNPQSIVEAGLDAFEHFTATCSGCTPNLAVYCTPKTNSLGCIPAIGVTGSPSASAASGFTIECTNVRNNKSGILFYSTTGPANVPFQGGTLCVASQIRRTPVMNSAGNPNPSNDCSGVWTMDFNTFARGAGGGNPAPELSVVGTDVWAQFWGRDNGFPAPMNTALSGGLSFTVCD